MKEAGLPCPVSRPHNTQRVHLSKAGGEVAFGGGLFLHAGATAFHFPINLKRPQGQLLSSMRYQVVESPNALQDSTAGSPRKPPRLIPSVDARLDSLEPRLSRFYVQLLVLTGASWAIQAAELVLLVFTRVLVANDIGMGTPVLEIFGASIFMGSMAGGPIFGHIADKFGRRTALLIAMVFSLGGLAVLARANAQYMLIIGRVVVGIGLGGQLSSTVVLVHELSPQSTQGRVVSLLDAFTGVGGLVGVVLAYAVAPWLGWRTTYLVVCGLVVYTVVLRVAIPESPRWLASVGRTEEAHAVVDKIECSHHFQPPYQKEVLDFTSVLEPPSSSATPPSSLFKRMLPSIVLWTLWIAVTLSAYALGIYVPTLISLNGYNMFGSWGTMVVLSVAQILGSLSAAMVLVSRDPQHALAGFAVLAAIVSVVLSYVSWSRGLVVTGSFLATALLSGCWSCVLAYTPGHYKNARRGRGVGYAVGVSRLAAVGGCYLYPHMFNVWILSVPALCWIFGGLLTVVSVGLVPRFGYQPLNQDDDSDSSVWMCEANLELDAKSSDSEERSIVTDTGDSNTLEETVSVNVR